MEFKSSTLESIIALASLREYYESPEQFMAEGSSFYFPLRAETSIDLSTLSSLLYAANEHFVVITRAEPYILDETDGIPVEDAPEYQLVVQVMYYNKTE